MALCIPRQPLELLSSHGILSATCLAFNYVVIVEISSAEVPRVDIDD